MKIEDVVIAPLTTLNDEGHDYMLVGSFATNAYCVPRGTQDIDVVVESGVVAIAQEIRDAHPQLVLDPQMGFVSVTATRKMVLEEGETQFKIEVFEVGDDPHHRERFARRVPRDVLGNQAWMCTAEDQIVTKLQWYTTTERPKDMDDMQKLIATQADALDWPYIERWAIEHGTLQTLRDVRTRIGV